MRRLFIVFTLSLVACTEGETAGPGSGGAGGAGGVAGLGGSAGNAAAAGAATAGSAGVTAGGAAGAAGGGGVPCALQLPAATLVEPTTAELVISGDPPAQRGIFDPSPVYPAGAAAGAMSYSAVDATNAIETRIAVSNDAGNSWTYAATVNSPRSVQVTTARCNGTCTGQLVHEVSSLAYTPGDSDAQRQWKLFTHSYVVLPGDELAYDLGYIGLFTAPDPAGPWTDEGKAVGWTSEDPISSSGATLLAGDYSPTADCVAMTEPSVTYLGSVLDLVLGCAYPEAGGASIRIEVLRTFDEARSFFYAGRMLSAQDALCLGGARRSINAAHTFFSGGRAYVSASVSGPTSGGFDGYRGCVIMPLAANTYAVQRDADKYPIVERILTAPGERFAGACAYAEGAQTMGYLVPELFLEEPPRVFRILRSGVPAP